MAVVGTVTRKIGSTASETSPQSGKPNVGTYAAHGPTGTLIGFCSSAAEGQRSVQAGIGGRIVRWARRDIAGGIEHWIGDDGT